MIVRGIVLVIGVFVALIGLSQIAAAHWWLRIMPWIMQAPHLRILGVVALLIGLVLTLAARRRVVGLRAFVMVLGILMLLGGAMLLVCPVVMKDTIYAYFMDRPHDSLLRMAYAGGATRLMVGIALLWSATRAKHLQ